MTTYLVVGLVGASVSEVVEADSPQEAIDRAGLDCPSICHQCSKELSVGDVYAIRVIDDGGAGEEVYTDDEADLLRGVVAAADRLFLASMGHFYANSSNLVRTSDELVDALNAYDALRGKR